jgi:hypothetical protein
MIELNVNNGDVMRITQNEQYGKINCECDDISFNISAGDMVMLINYYRYVKDNNIKCKFINYNGDKNK